MLQCDVTPRDSLLFRDNRPGGPGLPLMFCFPLPSVWYGAVRTHWLSSHGVSTADYAYPDKDNVDKKVAVAVRILGEAQPDPDNGELSVIGPFLSQSSTVFLPLPSVIQKREGESNWYCALPESPNSRSDFLWDLPGDVVPLRSPHGQEHTSGIGGWLSLKGWDALLSQPLEPVFKPEVRKSLQDEHREDPAFFELESRFGHSRNDALRIVGGLRDSDQEEAGSLYAAQHIRFRRDAHLSAYVSGLDSAPPEESLSDGFLWLGGEKRRADLRTQRVETPLRNIEQKILDTFDDRTGRVFATLITPGVFNCDPYNPVPMPKMSSARDSIRTVSPIAAFVGEPVVFSGWNMKENKSKSLKAAVPAGSTYFFEDIRRETFAHWLRDLSFQQSIGSELKKAGFGIAVFGTWRI